MNDKGAITIRAARPPITTPLRSFVTERQTSHALKLLKQLGYCRRQKSRARADVHTGQGGKNFGIRSAAKD
jgi:hypothetical protein